MVLSAPSDIVCSLERGTTSAHRMWISFIRCLFSFLMALQFSVFVTSIFYFGVFFLCYVFLLVLLLILQFYHWVYYVLTFHLIYRMLDTIITYLRSLTWFLNKFKLKEISDETENDESSNRLLGREPSRDITTAEWLVFPLHHERSVINCWCRLDRRSKFKPFNETRTSGIQTHIVHCHFLCME